MKKETTMTIHEFMEFQRGNMTIEEINKKTLGNIPNFNKLRKYYIYSLATYIVLVNSVPIQVVSQESSVDIANNIYKSAGATVVNCFELYAVIIALLA